MKRFGNSPPRGRRAAPRTPAPLQVELTIGGASSSATLAEISRTGATLTGVGALSPGDELRFRAGKVQAAGAVVWAEGNQCAIAFDVPIAASEVGRLRALANFVTSVSQG